MAKKKSTQTDEELRDLVIYAMLEKKGQEVVSLDLRAIPDAVAKFFVITHGDSTTQTTALFHSILEETKKQGHHPFHHEGKKNGEWMIIDFVDVVAHIFYREKRDFYQLEELWSDAVVTKHTGEINTIKKKAVRPKKTTAKTKGKKLNR